MNKSILDYYAKNQSAYLHGGGRKASMHLFHQLNIQGNETILEIGFGVGSSLLHLKSRYPNLELYGIEQNSIMYQTAKKRLKSSQIDLDHLHLLEQNDTPPFPVQSFDIIYLESVLGILPLETTRNLLKTIYSLLKTGGQLGLNDTLWLPWVSMNERRRINQSCLNTWGIPQANEHLSDQKIWELELTKVGFELNYFAAWDAKQVDVKLSLQEYATYFRDKLSQKINAFKKSNQKEIETLKTLPQKLFIKDQPYLNSYIMTATKINN